MAKREFLQLAHVFDSKKHGIAGWWWSEKLDGQRCLWDGGITRGLRKDQVPWANTEKDERYLREQICTGLWSRYGNIIYAPDHWINTLPLCPLDGELYIGRGEGRRQQLREIVGCQTGDHEGWRDVYLYVFDLPSYDTLFADGVIDETHYHKKFEGIPDWIHSRIHPSLYVPKPTLTFRQEQHILKNIISGCGPDAAARLLPHAELPFQTSAAERLVEGFLESVCRIGGEGLMIRDPNARYETQRSHKIVKLKRLQDAEGTVVGFTTGRLTDKGSKHLGKIGALVLRLWTGKTLELSGLTDEEREFSSDAESAWAFSYPGQRCPDGFNGKCFKVGDIVTFRYREESKDGIPIEARYWRKRDE